MGVAHPLILSPCAVKTSYVDEFAAKKSVYIQCIIYIIYNIFIYYNYNYIYMSYILMICNVNMYTYVYINI